MPVILSKLLLNFNIFAPFEASYLRRRVLLALDSAFGKFGVMKASSSAQAAPFIKNISAKPAAAMAISLPCWMFSSVKQPASIRPTKTAAR